MNPPADFSLSDHILAWAARARQANSIAELGFYLANDAYTILPFRQALVFTGADSTSRLQTVSGLAQTTEETPYLVWLGRTWTWLRPQLQPDRPTWFVLPADPAGMPADLRQGWSEWWPAGLLSLPLTRRSGETLGWVCFLLEQPPTERQMQALVELAACWSYCWEMLAGRPRSSWISRWRRLGVRQRGLAFLAILLVLFVPIRQSVLAPAEVVALDAAAVASPLDGVVQTIHVRPNQPVRSGQRLFSLDDTTLRNRLEVGKKSVAVAEAELQAATQKSFDTSQSKGELAFLYGRVNEKRAELAAVQTQLNRIEVLADHDGIAVFGDPDDWLGRPVSTGERIMLLANPAKPGVLIHLPLADAIALEVGAPLKLFLTVMPLSPLTAKITETSYQAVLSSEGIASYRLRASFGPTEQTIRIGLRGTAKIYGEWVCIGYYLLRRPLGRLREWSGW